MSYLGDKDFLIEVAKGNVAGHSLVGKFGRNPDIDPISSATAVPLARDVWDYGIAGNANFVPPTAARVHDLSSSSSNDIVTTGSGARTVRVYGLDTNYALQQEDVNMNGTGNAATSNSYRMIYRMKVLTAGSSGRNEGNIDATAQTDGTVTARITADNSQTLMAIYQVPAGKTGYVLSWTAEMHKLSGSGQAADFYLLHKEFNATWTTTPWHVRDTMALSVGTQLNSTTELKAPEVVLEKEFIKIGAAVSAVNQDVGARFQMLLVDD